MSDVAGSVVELLAPAGGPAQFSAALAAGADAIYCGFGKTFNARRGAESFTSETFAEAARLAHVAGARVYVTVNVAIRDDELPVALALVRRAWLAGADAFIIQDWGLLAQVRRRWPQIECHLSTQANVHDARAVAWCRELGLDRVTLSRELSLPEIATIAQEGVELECFGHGAICFCYSGVCQMSSSMGERSANRGMCAQPCRLPYDLVDKSGAVLTPAGRGRPLCPKDFYSFDSLEEMARAGVGSLKVEGRLKAPDYVFSVVSAYRAQLDDLAAGRAPEPAELEARRTRLKRAFNRDFTSAYLEGTSGDELMSYERSNNRGELVGTVVGGRSFGSVKVRRKGSRGGRERLRTAQVAEVDVRLNKPVGKGDLLELRPLSDPSQFLTAYAQEDAAAGEIICCKTTRVVEDGSLVRVIRSKEAMDAGAKAAELEIPRRRAVWVRAKLRLGEPLQIEMGTLEGDFEASVFGSVVEPARTRAVSREDVAKHVGRMGASAFEPATLEVELDEGCGVGFSQLHALRSEACAALEQAILEPYATRELTSAPSRGALHAQAVRSAAELPADKSIEVCAVVASPAAARVAREAGASRVYASYEALSHGTWPAGVIPVLDEVCREADHERQDPWVQGGKPVAVGNVSQLVLARDRTAQAELRTCIPVHNEACLAALREAGAAGVWLSPELSLKEIESVAECASVPVGFTVLGRARVMTSEHCVLQVADQCIHDCARCKLRNREPLLQNEAGLRFPVRTDLQGRSRIYAAELTDITPEIAQLMEAGVTRFAADCTLLSTKDAAAAVRRVVQAVAAVHAGRTPAVRLEGAGTGHLFAPIG